MKHPIPFRKTPLVLAIAASLTSPTWVQAAPGDPVGPEFRVNTYTTNHQSGPAVAMDAEGNFVVAWTSDDQDGFSYGIYAQRYNSAGVPQGAEFQVNTFTTNSQSYPAVAMDADGDFVVAWLGLGQDGYGIYGQRYTQAGVPQGPEFQVTNSRTIPVVAMDADGDFVVAWWSYYQSALEHAGIPWWCIKTRDARQAARPAPGTACVCAVCPAGGRTGGQDIGSL